MATGHTKSIFSPSFSVTIAFFQWGTSVSYGQTTAAVNLGNGSAAIPLSTPIVGLTAGQTYHFRAVASNSFGVAFGSDLTFTTPGGQFTITPSGHNVILSWPAGLRAALQETRRLAPASWTYSTSGTNHPVTIPVTNTASLYRLVLAPPNDDFANRTALSGAPSTVTALNAAASTETGEPPNANNGGGRSVWWSWTAPSNGSVTISTVGSDFDTLLSVYTGTALNALVLVSASDDIQPGNPQSQVTFTATQNVTYLISVDGYNRGTGAAFGTIKLNLTRP